MKSKNPALIYGLLGALILIILGVVLQMYMLSYLEKAASSDSKTFSPFKLLGLSLLNLAVIIGLFIYCVAKAIKEYKKINPDFTYKKLVGQGLTVTLIIALMSSGFTYLYNNYIDVASKEKGIELMEQIYDKLEIPDSQKEQQIEQLRNQDPIRQFTMSLALTLIFGLIVSLISASILNKRKIFTDNNLHA